MNNFLQYLKHLCILISVALLVPMPFITIGGGHPASAALLVMAIGLGIASPAVLVIAGYCLWLEKTGGGK
jgi:hypothetical protein